MIMLKTSQELRKAKVYLTCILIFFSNESISNSLVGFAKILQMESDWESQKIELICQLSRISFDGPNSSKRRPLDMDDWESVQQSVR